MSFGARLGRSNKTALSAALVTLTFPLARVCESSQSLREAGVLLRSGSTGARAIRSMKMRSSTCAVCWRSKFQQRRLAPSDNSSI